MQEKNEGILNRGRTSDLLLAVGVIGILAVMVVPMPTLLLDLLLSMNITFSLIILVNALQSSGPLQMSVFPSLMLVITLFRLSLNVASTRLILGQAYAGEMISAFGSFVVKDNYVVGGVIFVILVVIQYVVIVKGTERNAEVGARFTLDALPGKQMSIDADLNAGLINEEEALSRRENLNREANFYGAMDGAAKFVRGDAVAGIVITLVNILAGLVVGMVQLHMTSTEALATYTRLTIGDGLVSQIPALIVSTSAGIVVSRSSSGTQLGAEIGAQLLTKRKPLLIVAGTLGVLAFVPGIPTFPLLSITAAILFLARTRKILVAGPTDKPQKENAEKQESPEEYLKLDRLEVSVGYGLIPMMDRGGGNDFLERVVSMRHQLAGELGVLVPRIRVRDDIRLRPDEYEIRIKGHRVAGGSIRVGHHLAMGDVTALERLEGEETLEPAFHLKARWVTGSNRTRAEDLGLTVVSSSVVLATHLTETLKSHAWEILSRQDVQTLLDEVAKESPALVKDVVPELVSLGSVHRVLQNLLKERVPVRDLGSILEVLADFAPQIKEVDLLSEYVRAGLGRAITENLLGADRTMHAISIDPALEQRIVQSLQEGSAVMAAILSPEETQSILQQVKRAMSSVLEKQQHPAVLCSPRVRLAFRRLIETSFPTLQVLSWHEVASEVDVVSAGTVQLGAAGANRRDTVPAKVATLQTAAV